MITRERIPIANTEVFYAPTSNNLQKQFEVIRATTSNIISGSLTKQIEVIRSDRASIRADIINKFSVPLVDTEVFYAPTSSNLQKQIEVIKATTSNIAVGKASTITSINSRVFALSNIVAKTSSSYVVKSDRATIKADILTRLKVTNSNTHTFTLPPFGKTSSVTVLRDGKPYILSGNLSKFDNVGLTIGPYINGTVSINNIVMVVGRSITETNDVIIYYTYDNNTITSIPAGTSIATFYFASTTTFASTYPTGSTIRIENINNGYDHTFTVITSTNTSVSFLDPGDLPSTSGTYISTLGTNYTIAINFTATQYLPPYPVGTYVAVTNTSGQTQTVLVTAASNSSVAFNSPLTNFVTNGSAVSLAAASIDYYPQTSVSTNLAPTNARENLYYFYIAPGLRSNSTINQGRQFVSFANNVGGASAVTKLIKYSVLTVSTEVFFAPTNGNLQKQIAIIKDGTNNIVSGTLAKQIEIIKSITNNIFVGKTSSFNTVRADRTSIRADIITKLKVPIANTEIFYTPTSSNLEKRFETVKATTSNITVGKASSIAALKSVNNIIRTDTINRITVLNQFETEVFFTPTSSNLQKQIAIIRSIRNNIFVGKTSTVSSIKSSVFTLPINYNLQKQIEVIRATTSNVTVSYTHLTLPTIYSV